MYDLARDFTNLYEACNVLNAEEPIAVTASTSAKSPHASCNKGWVYSALARRNGCSSTSEQDD